MTGEDGNPGDSEESDLDYQQEPEEVVMSHEVIEEEFRDDESVKVSSAHGPGCVISLSPTTAQELTQLLQDVQANEALVADKRLKRPSAPGNTAAASTLSVPFFLGFSHSPHCQTEIFFLC